MQISDIWDEASVQFTPWFIDNTACKLVVRGPRGGVHASVVVRVDRLMAATQEVANELARRQRGRD